MNVVEFLCCQLCLPSPAARGFSGMAFRFSLTWTFFDFRNAGIPKFYRWLSERYPLVNQPLAATEGAPELDNLYLDMNGIIHNCTHGNDPSSKLTETEMILRIFNYLDKLVQV